MTTWATQRLDDLISGAEPPPVIRTMRLGTLDAWGEGRIISQTRQMIHVRADFRDADGNLLSESTAQQILQKFK